MMLKVQQTLKEEVWGDGKKEKERIIFQQQTLCKVVGMHEEKREKEKFFLYIQ